MAVIITAIAITAATAVRITASAITAAIIVAITSGRAITSTVAVTAIASDSKYCNETGPLARACFFVNGNAAVTIACARIAFTANRYDLFTASLCRGKRTAK